MNILKKKKLNCGLAYQFLGIKFFLLKKRKLENIIQCMLDRLCKYPVILHFAGRKVWVHENGYGVDLWNHYFKKMIDFLLGFKK